MISPDTILRTVSPEQQAVPSGIQTEAPDVIPAADLRQQVVLLRYRVNERIERAEAVQSRAEAVIATNAPSQAHKDYAEQLLKESRILRREAWELTQALSAAEKKLAEENTGY